VLRATMDISAHTFSLAAVRNRWFADLYGSFSVKWFLFVAGSLFGAERLFLVPSPAIRFAERAEGVKGPKC